ncbi:hypothetical protein R6Q59_003003 [Mikania micrantha]
MSSIDQYRGSDRLTSNVNGNSEHPMGHDEEEMRDLAEMLSKLNPMAEEFVPFKLSPTAPYGYAAVNNFLLQANNTNAISVRRNKSNLGHSKRRMNSRTSMAQREDVIRRTVYVSVIDHQVTEEQLATLFINCGQVSVCFSSSCDMP